MNTIQNIKKLQHEWLELDLTEDQISMLEDYNIISADSNSVYIIVGLGYGIIKADYIEKKYYITNNYNLLPSLIVKYYFEILANEVKKVSDILMDNVENTVTDKNII